MMIENRMVVDSEWESMEKEVLEKGYFDQLGATFVKEGFLWEVAAESVTEDSYYRDMFVEKVLDFIDSNKEAKEKFLKWFYPDYRETQ